MVVFNHKQVTIELFKHCILVIATDGREDILTYVLKPYQPCAADLHLLKGFYFVLQERHDPSETSEGLTYTSIVKKTIISYQDLGKIKQGTPRMFAPRRLNLKKTPRAQIWRFTVCPVSLPVTPSFSFYIHH